MNATQESQFYRRQDFDEVNRQQARMDACWQLSDGDWAAEERHWNLNHVKDMKQIKEVRGETSRLHEGL